MRGPRLWPITFASTSMPSIRGAPPLTSEPSRTSSTRSSFTEEPSSAARRSTRTLSPGATRYCLPPLTMTADSDASGLGPNRDVTGRPGRFAALEEWRPKRPLCWGLANQERGGHDYPHDECSEWRDGPLIYSARRRRPAATHQGTGQHAQGGDRDAEPKKTRQASEIIVRRRVEQSREQAAVGPPAECPDRVEPARCAPLICRRHRPHPQQRRKAQHINDAGGDLERQQLGNGHGAEDLRTQALRLDGRPDHRHQPAALDQQEQPRFTEELDAERQLDPSDQTQCDCRDDEVPLLGRHQVE